MAPRGVALFLCSHPDDEISELGLTECDDSFDCGDRAVRDASAYVTSIRNERGRATRKWLNGSADGRCIAAHTAEDTDDEAAAFFKELHPKL